MNKKIREVLVSLIILTVLVHTISANNHLQFKNTSPFQNQTIYVNDDNTIGPWNGTIKYPYRTIKDGISNATTDCLIFVFNGTYNESFNINKKVKILGENKTSTIIDGKYFGNIININTDNIKIENFTIRKTDGDVKNAAIFINSNYNLIKNCIIYQTRTGIYINNSNGNIIDNCTFHTNGQGIFTTSSQNNIISGCFFTHNSMGINTDNSQNNQIFRCYMNTNGIACNLNSSSNIEITHCNVSDNSANLGGIFVINCVNIIVENSIIKHNGAGISISSSKNIDIYNCELCFNTHFAVSMRPGSNDVMISKCNINNNLRYAIYIEEKNFCKINNNNIEKNLLFGIYSQGSICNAKYNWWGSAFGPSLTEFRKSSKISLSIGKINFVPWHFKSLENIGADWTSNEPYMIFEDYKKLDIKIILHGNDTDMDGVPDWWETKWGYNPLFFDDHKNIDEDKDGLNNFEECYTDSYGSNPYQKDVFLEIDWMDSGNPTKSNEPQQDLIDEIISFFNEQNIKLHIDMGQLGGGGEIPSCRGSFSFAKLSDLYWKYFLQNNLTNPRKNIFHYGIICNYCPDLNFPFFGWDSFDSFAISAEWLKKDNPFISREKLIVGAIVHHLGHTLGLIADTYNGIDNVGTLFKPSLQWWEYKNYKSCMNYNFKYKIFTYSDGSHGRGDFDDWSNIDYDFFKNTDFKL